MYFCLRLLVISTLFYVSGWTQTPDPSNLAHTYSIVAQDSVTGEIGVAVQTHAFGVGRRVPWAEAGVGAVATQSFTNPSFGPRGLQLLKEGKTAEETLQILIDSDDGREVRQVGIVDNKGNSAGWTGKRCIKDAGHISGKNYSVQANLMLNDKVWPAMAKAFEETTGELAERLLTALEAAQEVGGDIRGKQSAAMIVVKAESSDRPWADRVVDLRVDDHAEPLRELRRLLRVVQSASHRSKANQALEDEDIETALQELHIAQKLNPTNPEVRYWFAVSLANKGMMEEALPIFKEIFAQDQVWRTLTQRLPQSELLTVSEEDLNKILSQ
ncbi:DUF1028 domain-containing protein [bacterium]|nr:DUF1028 domain-containing protein [bacterium]